MWRASMERHSAKMIDLLQTLANCPKARSANIPRSRLQERYSKGSPCR